MKGPLFITFRYRRHVIQMCSDLKPFQLIRGQGCPGPMGPRYRPLAYLRFEDLLVGLQRLARFEVVDLPPRSLSHSSKGSSEEAK
jgi:hypothetical protein